MATILILDDRPANREFLVTLLGYAGYSLLEADDAETALASVRAALPDLVIADVLMPGMDGFEFVRELRADPAIASTRVIFYTATYLEAEARALAEACGVMHLLTKPAEPQQILETVQLALGEDVRAKPPPPNHEFERDHQRLLVDKLAQKVDELETLNAELEQRVAARTADLAEANTRLHELNMFKDNLLAITSHDLRSPLGAIQNMAEILLEDEDLPDDLRRRLTRNIYDSTHHLIDMVTKLLDLSRLEAGRVELEPIDLLASQVARQSIQALQASAEAKAITTQLVVEPGEQSLSADWMKLSQIMGNLLSNAIKFTPNGGQITVTVGPAPGGVRVSVADTGLGIPNDQLPVLFEKFRQVHTRGTADERGSGLGLAIVRELVDLHGGRIEVMSEPRRGSTFVVHLPADDSPAGPAA